MTALTFANRVRATRSAATRTPLQLSELDGELGASVRDRQFVSALARGLEVLRAFQPQDGALGNREIAERTGLPKPSVSRLTYTLTQLGYLEHVPRFSKYRISLGVLALGHACIGGAALRRASKPHMERLAQFADATIALGGRDRLSMVYLDVYRGSQTASFSLDAGARVPLHKTAMGYAYLWAIAEPERKALLRAVRRRDAQGARELGKQLSAAFKSLDKYGFCVAEGTFSSGMNGIGAALVLRDGRAVHAYSASAPAFQWPMARMRREVGPRLAAMAGDVQTELEQQTQSL